MKDEPNTPKQEDVNTAPEILDDWRECKGEWNEVELCHCGQKRHIYYNYTATSFTYDVCPKCGHRDKWSKRVVRDVREESDSRWNYANWLRKQTGHSTQIDPSQFRRNETIEDWTPDHCPVRDDPHDS